MSDELVGTLNLSLEVSSTGNKLNETCLYITDVPKDVNDVKLKNYLLQFGQVSHVQMAPEKSNSRFAFVCFVDTTGASSALDGIGKSELEGKVMSVELALTGILQHRCVLR